MEVTVKLRLRAISLRIETVEGIVGRELRFDDGLNVLRADNSSGKSTVLQAVIYALGLEGMLSARRDIPLPHSMTDYVEVDGENLPVQSSAVLLEIENSVGDVVVVERSVKSTVVSPQLVRVTKGPQLTGAGIFRHEDYFVRRAGAAQREAGFHRFLADFVGWDLPVVTRMDGSEGPLYLECLFPYFYVEQKHGWAGVQARIPTYLGIRDVAKRSPEYLLKLEIFERVLARQRLRSAASIIETQWQEELASYSRMAEAAGVVIARTPDRISDDFGPDTAHPQIFVVDRWLEVEDGLGLLRGEAARLAEAGTPTVAEVSDELEQELTEKQAILLQLLATHAVVSDELTEYEGRRDQLSLRIEALREDLQRHKDSVVLARLGSTQSVSMLSEHICPTCHQELHDGYQVSAHVMTTADNIRFIEQQLATFGAMVEDTGRVVQALTARRESLRQSSRQARADIRALRDSLTSRSAAPSLASVNSLVALRLRIERFEERQLELAQGRARLLAIHSQWQQNRDLLRGLADEGLTDADEETLSDLERRLRLQLRRYHFSSLPPDAVDVNRDTYRPAHEGFDLGFDLSASDMIRVIWAYLIGFMYASRAHSGNHPGLLIFDEPRQQETAHESYRELLWQAADEAASGAQIFIATSEASSSLREMMDGVSYRLLDLPSGQKLLQMIQPRQNSE